MMNKQKKTVLKAGSFGPNRWADKVYTIPSQYDGPEFFQFRSVFVADADNLPLVENKDGKKATFWSAEDILKVILDLMARKFNVTETPTIEYGRMDETANAVYAVFGSKLKLGVHLVNPGGSETDELDDENCAYYDLGPIWFSVKIGEHNYSLDISCKDKIPGAFAEFVNAKEVA